jgi:hypothetical protein
MLFFKYIASCLLAFGLIVSASLLVERVPLDDSVVQRRATTSTKKLTTTTKPVTNSKPSSSATKTSSSVSSSSSLVADSACSNTAFTRSCWGNGFSIATDYDTDWPVTGNTVSVSSHVTLPYFNPQIYLQANSILWKSQTPPWHLMGFLDLFLQSMEPTLALLYMLVS